MRIPAKDQILGLLRREHGLVTRFVLTSIARSLLAVSGILLIREFMSGVLGESSGLAAQFAATVGAASALWLVALLLIGTYVGASLANYDNQVVQQKITKVVELGVMERLVMHLLSLSVLFFDRQSHSDLVQAVRLDVSNLRMVVVSIARVFLEGCMAAGMIVAAIWLSPSLAFWVLLVLPLAVLPILAIARRTLSRSYAVRRTGYVVSDMILQILRGIRIIKAYQGEREEARRAIAKATVYFDELIRMVRTRSLAEVVLESLGGLSIVAVIIAGGFEVLAGTIAWPELLAFLMAVRTLHGPLNNLNTNYLQIQRLGASVARITDLLEERPEVRDAPDAAPLRAAPQRISLDRVGFSHGNTRILDGLSFEIRSGENLGIAGPSGAGKTTLLNLVVRFYDPSSGVVRFDGRDLREHRLADVYASIAIVTQEPFLFAATVRENIRCGHREASNPEVEQAARAADIHDEIVAMPEGYETRVGLGGRGLSGGQAQRINVARAILKNAPILLLDEATSSLDSIAEAKVQQAIDRLIEGRMSLIVAHRLSTLRNVDRILVLDAGRCVGLGSHEELHGDCALYARMWQMQQLGEPLARARARDSEKSLKQGPVHGDLAEGDLAS